MEPQRQGIMVTATGRVRIVPDVCLAVVGVRVQSTSSAKAIADATAKLAAMREVFVTGGITEQDLQTGRTITWYQNRKATAMLSLSVRIQPVETAAELLNDAVAAGGEGASVESVRFTNTDTSAHQLRARELAMAEARAKAEHLAELAGRPLGEVRAITENSWADEAAAEMSAPVHARAMKLSATPEPDYHVDPGTQEVVVDLQITFGWGN